MFKSLCIFGCGKLGKLLHASIKKYNNGIHCIFCDNDSSKHRDDEYSVVSPAIAAERIKLKEIDAILMLGAYSAAVKIMLIEQLMRLEVDVGSVYLCDSGHNLDSGLKKLSDLLCMDELCGHKAPHFSIGYNDIAHKKLFLIGKEKYVDDIADFFNDLAIVKCREITKKLDNTAIYVLCDFNKETFLPQVNGRGMVYKQDYIWMDDLIQVLRESEAYYTHVYHPGKQVVVLGDKLLNMLLVNNNPNMFVYATIDIGSWNQDIGYVLRSHLDPFPENPLFLLVTSEFISAKDAMRGAGYKFGTDFYIYDIENTKLAPMLEETIKSTSIEFLKCQHSSLTSFTSGLYENGDFWSCCNRMREPIGNAYCNDIEGIVSSPKARILHLSVVNRSHCFCTGYCIETQRLQETSLLPLRNDVSLPKIASYIIGPYYLTACSLFCRSCRNERVVDDSEPHKLHLQRELMSVIDKIKYMGQSHGDMLITQVGRGLLDANPHDYLNYTTNGMTMNRKNLTFLVERYSTLSIRFSIESTNKETFEYLRRGAKFETVIENLRTAGEFRRTGKIQELRIACVVQTKTFRGLEDMVLLGRSVNADTIGFICIRNWGTFDDEEFAKLDVTNPENPHHMEFLTLVATNPIFQANDVDFRRLPILLELYNNTMTK